MLKVYKLLDVTWKKKLSFTIIYICNSKSLYKCEILDSAVGKAMAICALKSLSIVTYMDCMEENVFLWRNQCKLGVNAVKNERLVGFYLGHERE